MNTQAFSTAATSLIATFGNTAQQAINAYRSGGERLADTLEQRWKRALKESSPPADGRSPQERGSRAAGV